jgi:plastocyanin
VVRVSQGGTVMSGANITWSVTAGGGSVTPTTSTTGADGLASTVWTLGPNPGANSVEASMSGATGSPVAFGATGTGAPPLQANVTVGDNVFNPGSSTIAAGGQVTWTWGGSNSHNVTFPAGTSSSTQTAGTFSRTFPTAGTFNYQCSIHGAAMSGTIVVQ